MSDETSSTDEQRTEQIDSVDLSMDRPSVEGSEGTSWCVEVVRGPMTGQRILLSEGETTSFGRAPECDVFLDDITVSRHHCDVSVTDDVVTVVDHGSTNGTYVDSQAIETKRIYAGDVIQIGRFVFVLTRRSAP
jgi:pSer/pThr/pTyr-binding forkhead associated (FHA) protein